MNQARSEQIPGIYRRRVGRVLVTALSDGFVDSSYDVFTAISEAEVKACLTAEGRALPPRLSINAYALQVDGKTYLVDCGSQDIMGPTCGRLPANLEIAGIAPEMVDAVLLTHIHPDHSNGLIEISTGRRLFPNAVVHVHQADIDHWFNDEEMAKADERTRRRYFQAGRDQIGPLLRAGLVKSFSEQKEVVPGVTAVPCGGHTPGHSGYLIVSEGESLFIWGDLVQVTEVQMIYPEATMLFDSFPEQAAASRMRLLEKCAGDDQLVAGMHVHFPGIGRVRSQPSGGYRFFADQWAFTV